ncbi:MAG: 3-deoxy-8-phosphooctulonate synthase [Planctomycetota bacterium]|jgi:2-dehydro-3-deoxyphosphooctonate aldolase (KDO 8-P synthase)|nr:3-deoxy-8-phosphooctulonate synthase [Planctomycetota bacterium]
MVLTRAVKVGGVSIGGQSGLALLAGPCVIESETHARKMAESLLNLTQRLNLPFVFKSSYDKANRSSRQGYRGPGLKEGLRILAAIRKDYGVAVLSDVHQETEVPAAAEVLDLIQIPAFLCRQTDFLDRVARAGKPVNLKKGQFMAPWDMANAVEKLEAGGNSDVILTERGSSFGYNNLVADFRSLPILRRLGKPVVFDATHSVQLPGGEGNRSGGQREFAPALARAAVAVGVDAVFLEVHDSPDKALCDGPNMIYLDKLEDLLLALLAIDQVVRPLTNNPAAM